MNFKILNKKQSVKILNQIEKQFGISEIKLNYGFLEKKDKIYVITKELDKINYQSMRINNVGLYICKIEKNGIRLSVEGSQMLGKKAKNSITLNEEETREWFKGKDIENKEGKGYIIVKNDKDILGCGRIKDNKLFNYFPKERRIEV